MSEKTYHLYDHEHDTDQSNFCGISDGQGDGATPVFYYVLINRPRFRKICEDCLHSEKMGLYLLSRD